MLNNLSILNLSVYPNRQVGKIKKHNSFFSYISNKQTHAHALARLSSYMLGLLYPVESNDFFVLFFFFKCMLYFIHYHFAPIVYNIQHAAHINICLMNTRRNRVDYFSSSSVIVSYLYVIHDIYDCLHFFMVFFRLYFFIEDGH